MSEGTQDPLGMETTPSTSSTEVSHLLHDVISLEAIASSNVNKSNIIEFDPAFHTVSTAHKSHIMAFDPATFDHIDHHSSVNSHNVTLDNSLTLSPITRPNINRKFQISSPPFASTPRLGNSKSRENPAAPVLPLTPYTWRQHCLEMSNANAPSIDQTLQPIHTFASHYVAPTSRKLKQPNVNEFFQVNESSRFRPEVDVNVPDVRPNMASERTRIARNQANVPSPSTATRNKQGIGTQRLINHVSFQTGPNIHTNTSYIGDSMNNMTPPATDMPTPTIPSHIDASVSFFVGTHDGTHIGTDTHSGTNNSTHLPANPVPLRSHAGTAPVSVPNISIPSNIDATIRFKPPMPVPPVFEDSELHNSTLLLPQSPLTDHVINPASAFANRPKRVFFQGAQNNPAVPTDLPTASPSTSITYNVVSALAGVNISQPGTSTHPVPGIPLHPVATGTNAPALHFAANPEDAYKSYKIPEAMEQTWRLAKNVEASGTKAGMRAHYIDSLVNHNLTPTWAVSMDLPEYLTLSDDCMPEYVSFRKRQASESLKCIAHLLRVRSRHNGTEALKFMEATQGLYRDDVAGFQLALAKANWLNELDRKKHADSLSASFKQAIDSPPSDEDYAAAVRGQGFRKRRSRDTQSSDQRPATSTTGGQQQGKRRRSRSKGREQQRRPSRPNPGRAAPPRGQRREPQEDSFQQFKLFKEFMRSKKGKR